VKKLRARSFPKLPDNEFQFHATTIYASGGMLLSGDDLTKIRANKLSMLRKLLPPAGVAARFEDESFHVGRMQLKGREVVSLLNWTNATQDISIQLKQRCRITDFWTGDALGTDSGIFEIKDMPGRQGRLLICNP
jgi:alpha-galactosidase